MARREGDPAVQVLLSTYNGAPFLDLLLESVLHQDYPRFSVLARDDGSTDTTPAILRRHATEPRMHVYAAGHVGAPGSFLDLLGRADPTADYIAFCDQDDVWRPDKLARATQLLDGCSEDRPALYCGRLLMVDADLAPLGLSPLPRHGPSFSNALVENIASGCTVVINAAARAALAGCRPSSVAAHDWWAYLVVTALGTAVYDAEPKVFYRQHERNAIGVARTRLRRAVRRIARFRWNRRHLPVHRQALQLQQLYGSRLDGPTAGILGRFIDRRRSRTASLRYALRPEVFRQRPLDDLILRVLLASRLM